MTTGDRVKLRVAKGPFQPGAKGKVSQDFGDGNIAVRIDTRADGTKLPQPVPLPPSPKTDFAPA